jgi:hypothetical protein
MDVQKRRTFAATLNVGKVSHISKAKYILGMR